MKNLLGKRVHVRELNYFCAVRDGQPEEVVYEGVVINVDGHMIQVQGCRIVKQNLSRPQDVGTIWFNTMATSFQSIRE